RRVAARRPGRDHRARRQPPDAAPRVDQPEREAVRADPVPRRRAFAEPPRDRRPVRVGSRAPHRQRECARSRDRGDRAARGRLTRRGSRARYRLARFSISMRRMNRRRWLSLSQWLLLLVLVVAPGLQACIARTPQPDWVSIDALPQQAGETLARVRNGGPFRYARDGAVFLNREGQLPRRERGYYT